MTRSLPLTAVLIAALVATLRPWHRTPRFDDHGAITAGFRTQARALGRTSRGEWNVTAVFVAALACWLYPGTAAMIGGRDAPGVTWFAAHLPEEMVGLAAGLVLFALPTDWRRGEFTVDWHDAMRIDWGTILLFGGGMALGGLFATTRLDVALGEALRGRLGTPGLGTLTAAGIGLSIAMSEFTSNTATATVTVPLMIALARAAGLDPVTVGIATTLAASFGNMLPVSTAPNAIVYGSGRVPLSLMMAGGLVFDLLGGLGIWIVTQVAAAGGP
jgi:sodium-dependent dicarboxylate transporter 2/3/5